MYQKVQERLIQLHDPLFIKKGEKIILGDTRAKILNLEENCLETIQRHKIWKRLSDRENDLLKMFGIDHQSTFENVSQKLKILNSLFSKNKSSLTPVEFKRFKNQCYCTLRQIAISIQQACMVINSKIVIDPSNFIELFEDGISSENKVSKFNKKPSKTSRRIYMVEYLTMTRAVLDVFKVLSMSTFDIFADFEKSRAIISGYFDFVQIENGRINDLKEFRFQKEVTFGRIYQKMIIQQIAVIFCKKYYLRGI